MLPSAISATAAASGGGRKNSVKQNHKLLTTPSTTSSTKHFSLTTLIYVACVAAISFYLGLLTGTSTSRNHHFTSNELLQQHVDKEVREALQAYKDAQKLALLKQNNNNAPVDDTSKRFPAGVQEFAVGMATVSRDDFAKQFQLGIPMDPSTPTNQDVLILYSQAASLPTSNAFAATEAMANTVIPRMDSIDQATENCDYFNLILTDHSSKRRQCVALMGQYEAFHIQKYMRLPAADDEGVRLDSKLPLRFVSRGAQSSGRMSMKIPTQNKTNEFWDVLTNYLNHLPELLEELRPVAAKQAAAGKYPNTIVVLVCNFGQSELLLNFLCSAMKRNLDLSSVLVFCTDQETLQLVQAYTKATGIAAFYNEEMFGTMPKAAANRYGDASFTAMMMAKVYVVHLLTLLGHDLLFQDVDVVWYRHPLQYFFNPDLAQYDIYFQDDGNHAVFYSPYSANTGFYFIRANDRTRHFFNSLLLVGDLIVVSRSHQIPLVALLQEHASMFGLKIKIFARTENDFPGGHAFHRRRDLMKDIIAGRENPYIFHMSWTLSKENKRKFFQQLGEWMVADICIHKTVEEISRAGNNNQDNIVNACCLKEPNVKCHYKDKPSKYPCPKSPVIDGPKGRPFWP